MASESKNNSTVLYAPCGIDCGICEAFIATHNDDTELFEKLADNYLKQFNKTIERDSLKCDGCASKGRHIGFCDKCCIRVCANEKGFATCAQCGAFPCEKGGFIWVEGSLSKATLELLKSNTQTSVL